MPSLCLVSGSVMPPAGKVQAVSVPVGYHCSGTTPDEVNSSSSLVWLDAAWAKASSRGSSEWASGVMPRAFSSWRRVGFLKPAGLSRVLRRVEVLSSFMAVPLT